MAEQQPSPIPKSQEPRQRELPRATLSNETNPNRKILEEKVAELKGHIKGRVELVSGIPIFTLEDDVQHDLEQIVKSYGEETVFRIINANFIPDALEFGTDKAHVDEHDFRRVAQGAGYDIWSVEDKAVAMGLRKSDAFCGTPQWMFAQEVGKFNSSGLGIPEDRAGILVFDATKLNTIEVTDGYVFKDPNNKKQALLGVVLVADRGGHSGQNALRG